MKNKKLIYQQGGQLDTAGMANSAISAIPQLMQGAQQPSGPEKGKTVGKTIGSTAGGIGGAIAGSVLLPGVGTIIGGSLGSMLGGLAGGGIGKMVGNQNQEFKQETNQFMNGGQSPLNQSNMNSKLTHYKGDPNITDGISVGDNIKVDNNETNFKGYIFSHKLGFADLSKKIERKYSKRPDDKLSKESKERELGNLVKMQESTGLTNQGNQMWSGGWMKNINNLTNQANDFSNYTQPGPLASTTSFNNILTTEDKNNVLESGKIRTNMGVVDGTTINPKDEGSIIDSSFTNRLNLNNGIMGVNKPKNYKQPGAFNLNTPNLDAKDGNLAASKFIGETKGENNYNPTPPDSTKPLQTEVNPLGYLASNVGPAFDLLQGLKGGDDVQFDRVKQTYANPNPAITSLDNATSTSFNNARNAIRNNASSSGEYLAMMNNLSGSESLKRGLGKASIKSEYDKINSGTANQISAQNANIQMAESTARQQETDAARSTMSQGLHNFGQNTLGYQADLEANKTQNKMLPFMSDRFDLVEDADGNISFKRKTIKKSNSKNNITPAPDSK